MADTAALVVALSAQLTKFEKDMQKAGVMADDAVGKIEKKFSSMNPQIKASFFGNFFSDLVSKGIDAAGRAISDLATRFDELQKSAEYAGVTMQWLYGLQAAAISAGSSAADLNIAVKSVAFSLDEIKRGGDNALKTLLTEPGNKRFLGGAKIEALEVEQTLRIIGDISRALPNELQRVDVAKHLGMPESTVALWRQGGDAVAKMAREAAAGAPDLQRAADASKALAEAWKEFTKNVSSGWTENIRAALQYIVGILLAIQQVEAKLLKGGPLEGKANQELARWEAINAALNKTPGAGDRPRINVRGGTQEPPAVDPYARKTATAAGQADFERAEKQLRKHIAAMEADTKAVGDNAGQQEYLRVQAQLTQAALEQYKTVSPEVAASIERQAQAAGQAALELARVRHQYNELSAASKEFGSALADGFKAAVFEGKKLNEVMSDLLKRLSSRLIDKMFDLLFASPGTGGASIFQSLFAGKRAGGGPVQAGRAYLVGEQGPELMVPNMSGMVQPNNLLRAFGDSNGGSFNYSPAIDARGASVEAVARLAQMLEADRRAFASKTIAVIQSARRGRMPGL